MTFTRSNFRGRPVSLAAGPAAVLLLSLAAVVSEPVLLVAVLPAGVAGLYDDIRGDGSARGLAGHLRAVLSGRLTSGAVKVLVVGLAGLAFGLVWSGLSARGAVAAVLVAGTANLVNLFDLRPGRALKVVVVGSLPLLGVTFGRLLLLVALVLLPADLRERTMLGDAGANAFGAALGGCAATAAPVRVAAGVALVVVALNLVSERVSFSRVIDALPPLRWADRLGRLA